MAKLIKSTIEVALLTFISRIFGYARDMIIAFFLGATVLNDIFIVALRLPNMFRSVFGEGAFSAAFVPLFSKKLKTDSEEQIKNYLKTVQSALILALLVFTVVMVIFMPYIIQIIAPGFYNESLESYDMLVFLARITFPYIIFISLMAFYGGIANSYGNYAYFAAAPIILNLVLLTSCLFGTTPQDKVFSLCIGTVIAGILEMIFVMWFVVKRLSFIPITLPQITPDIKILFTKILPGIIGSGIAQINIFITTVIASLTTGGISYLYYADRIYQLPLALIGTALGTVLVPILSKTAHIQSHSKFKAMQNRALVFSMFLALPCTAILIIIPSELISLLFERGEFTKHATLETAIPLAIFALALPAFIASKIYISCFYSIGDTKTPVRIAAISVTINIITGLSLMPLLGHIAVAIGALVSSYFTLYALILNLNKRKLIGFYNQSAYKLGRILLAVITSSLIMLFSKQYLTTYHLLINIIISCTIFTFCYFIIILKLKVYRLGDLVKAKYS